MAAALHDTLALMGLFLLTVVNVGKARAICILVATQLMEVGQPRLIIVVVVVVFEPNQCKHCW